MILFPILDHEWNSAKGPLSNGGRASVLAGRMSEQEGETKLDTQRSLRIAEGGLHNSQVPSLILRKSGRPRQSWPSQATNPCLSVKTQLGHSCQISVELDKENLTG